MQPGSSSPSWRLLISGCHDAATNMAVDEALLHLVGKQLIPPTLRLYGWTPAAISLGYFQKLDQTINIEECKKLGIDVVRRLTGGGALLHDKEVTYSFVWDKDETAIPADVRGSYYEILQAIQHGLREHLQVPSELARDSKARSQEAYCLSRESCYDLTVGGKKLVGSAQRRTREGMLQHGSVLLDLDADKVAACFGINARQVKEKVTTINSLLHPAVSFDSLADILKTGFEHYFHMEFKPGEMEAFELSFAEQLRREKYAKAL